MKQEIKITGKVVDCLEPKSGVVKNSGTAWEMQEYVIEYTTDEESKYPKNLVVEAWGEENISKFNLSKGDKVTVYFDIDAKQFNGRWYGRNRIWKIERDEAQQAAEIKQAAQEQPTANFTSQDAGSDTNSEVLPF